MLLLAKDLDDGETGVLLKLGTVSLLPSKKSFLTLLKLLSQAGDFCFKCSELLGLLSHLMLSIFHSSPQVTVDLLQ